MAIPVDTLAFGKDERTGKPVLPNKRLYRTLNQGGELSDEEMFHEWSPEFREASIISGLDAVLKKNEFVCGLAYGTEGPGSVCGRGRPGLYAGEYRGDELRPGDPGRG